MDKSEFRKILKKVEKPARYLGNEVNSIHKDTSNKDLIRYVQCFPDLYRSRNESLRKSNIIQSIK